MVQDVIIVKTLADWKLLLTFANGQQREVDIAAMVPFDGIFEPLKDPNYFQKVRVEPDVGTIVWPNGADLCPDVLYQEGKPITAHTEREGGPARPKSGHQPTGQGK